jgi:uncharacterized protein GlcG (DUF336 family)
MTGGYGGLMEVASRAAAQAGGRVIGLPMRGWAQRIVERAVDDASRESPRISVAVADEAGALLAFARMDGAIRLSARTAVAKTSGARATALTLARGPG